MGDGIGKPCQYEGLYGGFYLCRCRIGVNTIIYKLAQPLFCYRAECGVNARGWNLVSVFCEIVTKRQHQLAQGMLTLQQVPVLAISCHNSRHPSDDHKDTQQPQSLLMNWCWQRFVG